MSIVSVVVLHTGYLVRQLISRCHWGDKNIIQSENKLPFCVECIFMKEKININNKF